MKVLQVLVDIEGGDSGGTKLGSTLDPRPVLWCTKVLLVALMIRVIVRVGGVRATLDLPVLQVGLLEVHGLAFTLLHEGLLLISFNLRIKVKYMDFRFDHYLKDN